MRHNIKKRRLPLLIGAGVLLVALALIILLPGDGGEARAQGSVASAEATIGTLATTVTGTGNLETETGQAVRIPAGLTVDDVLVAPGDIVAAGDVLATFDLGSIQSRIAAVQAELDELDREIERVRTDTEPTTITTRVSGTVEAVFAETDDRVTDTMLAHGALLIIAIDGSEETLAVTGTSGRISRVHVGVGDRVRAGAMLFTLADVDASPAHRELVRERTEQAEILLSLLRLAENGTLTAAFDGIVESVAIGDAASGSASPGIPGNIPAGLPPGMFGMLNDMPDGEDVRVVRLSNTDMEPLTTPTPPAPPTPPPSNTELTNIADLILAPPVTGQTPQTTVSGTGYTGTVQWIPSSAIFTPGTTYTALIILTPGTGYTFGPAALDDVRAGNFPTPGATVVGAELMFNALAVTVTFPPTAGGGGGGFPGLPDLPDFNMPSFNMPSFNMPNIDASAFAGMDGGAASPNEITAFTIAAADTMQLVVVIDERDILSLEVGQRAEVSLDAIEGELFGGEISRINTSGTAAGGGARYEVEITIPRTPQMLPGMSASAVITTDEVFDILLIPVEAVQEEGGRIYVYTALIGNEPTDPVDVQTGISDGLYVEILHGLNPGDTVYYIVIETFRWPHWGMGPGWGGGGGGGGGTQ
ncbi:MAG: HlyD family efflux transporter periplasmic adaptor subunit [Oscillospiraceae bacterium]|nr:HlyD family efflux transporter periplasmic adaptor subunit [Oscillospiraceae bacterium]